MQNTIFQVSATICSGITLIKNTHAKRLIKIGLLEFRGPQNMKIHQNLRFENFNRKLYFL